MSLFQSKLTRYLAISSSKKTNHSSDYMEIEEEDGQSLTSTLFKDRQSKVDALQIKKQMKKKLWHQFYKKNHQSIKRAMVKSDSEQESSEMFNSQLEAPEFRRHQQNLQINFVNKQVRSIIPSEEQKLNLAFNNPLNFELDSKKDIQNTRRNQFFNSLSKERSKVFSNKNPTPTKSSARKTIESNNTSIEVQKHEPIKTRQKNKNKVEPQPQLTIPQKIVKGIVDERSQMRLRDKNEYSIFYKEEEYWFSTEQINKINPRWIVSFYAQRASNY